MTITYLGPKPGSLSGNNNSKVRTYSATYLLSSDSVTHTAYDVGSNASLPYIGQAHPQDPLAYCNGLSPQQTNGFKGWEVTATWTTENSIDGEQGQDADPEADRPKITWNGSTQNVSIYKDRDGKGIQNSAGDPMLALMDKNFYGVTVSTNVTSVPSWILTYKDSINNAAITVGGLAIAAGVARLVFPGGFISPAQQRGDFVYYTFSYELIFDAIELHAGQLLDQGYNERFTDDNTSNGLRAMTNDDLTAITEPAQLNGLGERLIDPTPATSAYITVNRYFQKDFSVLPGVTT